MTLINTTELEKTTIDELQLTDGEVTEIKALIGSIMAEYNYSEDIRLVQNLWRYLPQMPERVLTYLNEFKYAEKGYGSVLIKGYPIDQGKIGLTPPKEMPKTRNSSTLEEEILLMLYNAILGDLIGWDCQCDGQIINDIHPISGNEFRQINSSSKVDLSWHIEESFHPYRADYISLLCLRNPDAVPSMVGSITNIDLPKDIKDILFQPRFIFHPEENFTKPKWKNGAPSSVFFGDYDDPYIRIDPDFMDPLKGDQEAKEALDYIIAEFTEKIDHISLEPGDCIFVDNYRAIHGRRAFTPRYDGFDRWLLRLNVARDLRKSRDARISAESRVITTD